MSERWPDRAGPELEKTLEIPHIAQRRQVQIEQALADFSRKRQEMRFAPGR